MIKRILSVLLLVAMLAMGICAFAAPADKAAEPIEVQEEAASAETQEEAVTEKTVKEPAYVPLIKELEYRGYEVVFEHDIKVKSASYDEKKDTLTIVLKNQGKIHWDWCTPWDAPEIDQEEIKSYIKNLNAWRKSEQIPLPWKEHP